jgi:hypothetical protein
MLYKYIKKNKKNRTKSPESKTQGVLSVRTPYRMRNPRTDFFRSYALETTLFPHPSLCGIIILEITNGFDFLLIAGPPICSPVGCLDLSLFGVSDRAN